MKRRKIRYILTTVTLIISVALFGGVMIVSDSFNEMMLETFDKQMGTADILIKPANSTDGWFDPAEIQSEIEDIKHLESIAYRITGFNVYISATDSGNQVDNSTRILVNGIDHEEPEERALGSEPFILDSIIDGKYVEDLLEYVDPVNNDSVLVISESLKIKLGKDFEAGDSVWVFPVNGTLLGYNPMDTGTWQEYTVVAVIRDIGEARDFDPENPSEASMFDEGPGIYASINNTRMMVDGANEHTGEYNLAVVGVDDIYSVSSVAEDITINLNALSDDRDWRVNDLKSDSLEMIETSMSTMRTMFMMFGVIALTLSVILMMNIFNIIKKEQEYETGMFQAIGASKAETFKMFLTQGAVMGVIGALIGTAFSYLISYVIFSVTLQTIQNVASQMGGFTVSDFTIVVYPTTLITTFVIGLISCIVASLYPSWKASRKPIIECLNPIEEKSKREKKHYVRRIIFFILGGLLLVAGLILTYSGSDSTTEFQSTPGPPQGMILSMFAPILVLFAIIWLLALSIKPFNKVFVYLFSPYLRKTRLLTEKNILRHRRRTTLTFTMIAITTSFLIGMSVMMDSMRAGIHTTVNDFMGADIRVITFNTPRSFEAGLLNQTGVDDVMGVSHQNAQIQIGSDWIGHGSLESEFNESITANVLDTEKIKEHMTKTQIISPSSMSLDEMMDVIASGNNIILDENFAKDYDVSVGENISVKFSLGITFANLTAMLDQDTTNAQEDSLIVNMTVIAVVRSIQGFSTVDIMGFASEGKTYNVFISWESYENIANKNLPGGGTDLAFRQLTQTGNPMLDIVQPNWFNFSNVETILNSISGIEYYTTRMDYYSPTAFSGIPIDFMSPITGIHINSSGKLKSDSYFGNNSLVAQKVGYLGDTMEELLNTTGNICVVDELFMMLNPTIGIGDNITIFPQQFMLNTINAGSFPYISAAIPYMSNYTSMSGSTANFTLSDDIYLSFESNQEWLAFNITTSLLTPHFYKAVNVTIETSVNSSVEKLELEALNMYTNSFEKLGSINNSIETNNTFYFNMNHNYVDPLSNDIKLRVIGYNSTYTHNYNLAIDSLKFGLARSVYNTTATTWPKFEIIGVIKSPTLYNTEKYNWYAGFETGYDISGNSIYLSYENARNIVFPAYKGADYSNDLVTSVLVHCDQPENISTYRNLIFQNLHFMHNNTYWSIIDLKTLTLAIRTNVYDWFAWVEKGIYDEDVLEEIVGYIEDRGYLIIFAFTRSFASSTFRTMINLLTFITNGLLMFSIIIAMIGLTLHSLLTTMARRREIGMLRAIGLSKKGVIHSISGETLILALLGVFTGISAGIVQGSLMVDAMPTGGFLSVTWTIPWLTITILVAIVLITVILSSRYPAKWAANLNIIDAVRTR
ncbi:MAG: FtsX-like permease family protein [Asgard group archaeon]|nr:FtsX-like permease family protein [Asgard group archaeon]